MVELNHILGFHYQSTMSNNWPSRPGPVSQSELGKRIVGCLEVLILYVCLWGQPILILWKVDCLKIQHVSHCFSICSCYYTIFHHQFSSGFPQKWCYHQAAFYMIGGMSDVREKATGNRGAVFRNVTRATKLWGLVQVFIVIAEAAKLAAVAAGK
jgi:hypothetical protein